MLQKLRGNKKGFTLIELMIVIAIIGILAAIAIPNFIAYRNKSYCAQTERAVASVAAALADYYAIAKHTVMETDEANLKGLPEQVAVNGVSIFGASLDTMTITMNRIDPCPTTFGSYYQVSMPGQTEDGWIR